METTTINIDGFLVNPETGEILGHETAEQFHVRDADSANWVMRKMLAEQAAMEAAKSNLEKLVKQHESRLNWLQTRFSGELESFAREQLADQKTKTLTLPYGRLSFRTTPERVALTEDALPWLEAYTPEAVKITKSPLVSKLTGEALESAVAAGVAEVVPAGESFAVKLGGSK
jgi:hypothetical protein